MSFAPTFFTRTYCNGRAPRVAFYLFSECDTVAAVPLAAAQSHTHCALRFYGMSITLAVWDQPCPYASRRSFGLERLGKKRASQIALHWQHPLSALRKGRAIVTRDPAAVNLVKQSCTASLKKKGAIRCQHSNAQQQTVRSAGTGSQSPTGCRIRRGTEK